MDISVIIVNYNTCELTINCIRSVYELTSGIEYEIILVDNYSEDGSLVEIRKQFPEVVIVENKSNLGFGRANNKGAEYAKGKYLFLLNSDTILVENVLKKFFLFMEEHTEYVSCGCNLIDTSGKCTISHGCLPSLLKEIFLLGLYKLMPSYYNNYLSDGQTVLQGNLSDTGYISGADIFVRKEVYDELKGFDEKIFLYFEETDLFYRMKERGYKSCIIDSCKIIHLGGASSSVNVRKITFYVRSLLYYYRKHHSSVYAKMVKYVLLLRVLLFPMERKRDVLKVVLKS